MTLAKRENAASPPSEWHQILRSAGLLALLFFVYVVVQILLVLPGLATRQADFSAFYHPAARAILEGRSPYSVAGLIYPPLLPFVLLPLALLPSAGARLIWFALSHVFVGVAGLRVWRALGASWGAGFAVVGAWATSGALFVDLREGQLNTLLLLLVVFAIWPLSGRPRLAPATLGVAIALKLWPGVILFVEVLRCRWAAIARALSVALVLLLLPWLFVMAFLSGPIAPPRSDFWAGSPGALNGSLPGLALRLLDRPKGGAPVPPQWVAGHSVESFRLTRLQAALSSGIAVVLFAAGAATLRRTTLLVGESPSKSLASAAFIALALVCAPVVWPHYHVLQLPGVAILGERFIRRRAWARLVLLGIACLTSTWAMALIMGPYLAHFGLTVAHPLLLWTLTSMTPAGALAIWFFILAELNRQANPRVLSAQTVQSRP